MILTNDIIHSFLYCQYKSYLKSQGKEGERTEYERLQETIKNQSLSMLFQRITAKGKTVLSPNAKASPSLFVQGVDFLLNYTFESPGIRLQVDALEKTLSVSDKSSFSYILTVISSDGHITKPDKLLITCLYLLLQHIPEICPEFGKFVYGSELKTYKVIYKPLIKEAQGILEYIHEESMPALSLNKHCVICEFQQSCRDDALRTDHLSLLGGIHAKEIEKFNKKGIFTINQLSYIFRPRRRRNPPNNAIKPHSFPLQALAIREQKIYIHETPQLPKKPVEIYLDVEGLPDLNFHYLIGVLIKDTTGLTEHSFWANSKAEEKCIFQELLVCVGQYSRFTIFHYGNYEIRYLKKMQNSLKDTAKEQIDTILASCCNVLSYFYSNIYLPSYTNGLKDVANLVGFRWSEQNASGVQSIVWRKQWEQTQEKELKRKLLQYNMEDCYALMKVKELVQTIITNDTSANEHSQLPERVYPGELKRNSIFSFQDKNFALPEMELINTCAYFDYQKERVHVRSNDTPQKRATRKRKYKRKKLRVNATVPLTTDHCPECGTHKIKKKWHSLSKDIINLKFSPSGVKRWVTKYTTHRYYCEQCEEDFILEEYMRLRKNFGHQLKSWTIFQHIVNKESFTQIQFNLHELFQINVSDSAIHGFKVYIREYYEATYEKLLQKILQSPVIYVDETPFNMIHETIYAWIFTNGEEVLSLYKPTREGDFLKELLHDFKGVLVSDFFQAYDSLDCFKQKCLIHLLRDFNDDLLANPFEEEFKDMTRRFTTLLQRIVKTVDKYGLQRKHLQKHKHEVDGFFTHVLKTHYTSEVAQKYQARLTKHRDTLFTFLDYDNLAWNNTYAEHAIKILATHRNKNIKFLRESRMDDYLRIMSLYQTCEYKRISFLKFLLSGELDIDEYHRKAY